MIQKYSAESKELPIPRTHLPTSIPGRFMANPWREARVRRFAPIAIRGSNDQCHTVFLRVAPFG